VTACQADVYTLTAEKDFCQKKTEKQHSID
jgi:hypothetical protein